MALYDDNFYLNQSSGSFISAKKLLSSLFEDYQPRSVIDFGCGVGTWLAAAEQLGASQLIGLDGDWVDTQKLLSPNITFQPTNFETIEHLDKFCDLAISVEVAEHFEEQYADKFIDLLTQSADLIVFGAAIPLQGGTNHVNEQPQSYWIEKFAQRGFQCFDYFRPKFWHDDTVAFWYRQNTFLFARSTKLDSFPFLEKLNRIFVADIVHPALFQAKAYRKRAKADILRDAALELENSDLELSLILMKKALNARPSGGLIKRKLNEYLDRLKQD